MKDEAEIWLGCAWGLCLGGVYSRIRQPCTALRLGWNSPIGESWCHDRVALTNLCLPLFLLCLLTHSGTFLRGDSWRLTSWRLTLYYRGTSQNMLRVPRKEAVWGLF